MRKFLFAAALSVAAPLYVHSDAQADHGRFRVRAVAVTRARTATVTTTGSRLTTAQAKSTWQASFGRLDHVGPVPAGCREGVGFSTVSADHALAQCCYSNSGLPILEQAVVKGERGWFATKIFGTTKATCTNCPK